MTHEFSELLRALTVAASPVLLFSIIFFRPRTSTTAGRRTAALGVTLGFAAFATALLATLVLFIGGPVIWSLPLWGPVSLGVYFDNLSAILLLLVSFLGAVVLRFSYHYMDGDIHQQRFTRWLCLTAGSVLCIIISGNLLFFALAWSMTSLCLHQLLVIYPDRPAALLAARKKFIISRMGDLCLLGAIILTYHQFHTWDFHVIFEAAARLHNAGSEAVTGTVSGICLLLAASALLKSAQFPFHSWLPDTMETPTPVSALMHAGIINAGGFLIVRLSPLMTLSPGTLHLLVLVGAVTALFASLVMLTHASVKRALAFSTVAQMGFMILQCGLGAFSLAVLHLVAHSLYKAHAFLASGSIISLSRSSWTPEVHERKTSFRALCGAVILTVLLGALGIAFAGFDTLKNPDTLVLGGIFLMSLCYMTWNLWSQSMDRSNIVKGLGTAAFLGAAYLILHQIFRHLLAPILPAYSPVNTPWDYAMMALLLIAFFMILIFQSRIPLWVNGRMFRALYVHSRNGFYFNTLANRITTTLWPIPQTRQGPRPGKSHP